MFLGLCAFIVLVLIFKYEKKANKPKGNSGKDAWGKDTDAQYFFFEDFHNKL